MNEKIYKTMTTVGAGNIVLGVIMIVTGIAAGVITIVGGARLLKNKSGLTFLVRKERNHSERVQW